MLQAADTFVAVMMKHLFVSLAALTASVANAQPMMETPMSDGDSAVVIASGNEVTKSDILEMTHAAESVVEEAMNEKPFNGVLNPELHELIQNDTNFQFRDHWWTESCFSLDNDLTQMNGEIWLYLVDSLHDQFHFPVDGKVLSGFKPRGWRFHKGLDIDLETGDTVYAAFSGRIRYSMYNQGGYGNLVIIRHHNGLETYYAHLSKLMVDPEDWVEAGEPIGLGGSTGRSYGPHLHFECRFYDNAFDPMAIFDFENRDLRDCNLLVNKELFTTYGKFSGEEKIMAMRRAPAASQPVKNGNGTYHTIRSGDTLWDISRRYGTSVDRICQLNGISRNTTLHIGRALRVL